jgi:hypothetical protein
VLLTPLRRINTEVVVDPRRAWVEKFRSSSLSAESRQRSEFIGWVDVVFVQLEESTSTNLFKDVGRACAAAVRR